MAASYSLDLRDKILRVHQRGLGSQGETAAFFGVMSFVEKLLQRVRDTADAAAVLAGLFTDRKLLVEGENLFAQGEGAYPRSA